MIDDFNWCVLGEGYCNECGKKIIEHLKVVVMCE